MKVNVDLSKNTCTVTKEAGDPRFTKGGWNPTAESPFLYHVQQALKAQGYDVIKKRMWKDGCMVDDLQQWVRTRVLKKGEGFGLYNDCWATNDLGEDFNALQVGESLSLHVYREYIPMRERS